MMQIKITETNEVVDVDSVSKMVLGSVVVNNGKKRFIPRPFTSVPRIAVEEALCWAEYDTVYKHVYKAV